MYQSFGHDVDNADRPNKWNRVHQTATKNFATREVEIPNVKKQCACGTWISIHRLFAGKDCCWQCAERKRNADLPAVR